MNLVDVSSLTENGKFYPILLLCLKELETLKGQVIRIMLHMHVYLFEFSSFHKSC